MDMQSLQRQIEEVRYLHSLWYQGPPQNPNPNPNPNSHLRPRALPSFKKTKKKEKKIDHLSNQSDPSVSKSHWPTEPPPKPQPQTGWADPIPTPTRPATAEEQAKLIAARSQQNALKSCRDFLYCSDSDEDEDEDDHEPMEDGEEETEKYDFFFRVFSDDDDLRSYYEKNFEHGDFSCLVCQGIGKRSGKNIGRHLGKKFGDCVALLNHSVFITKKTKGRIGKIAHRAFGRVICRVIGWKFDRLPSIVLDSEEPLGRTLAKANSKEVPCSGENEASNQEKTSEPMDSVGTDGVN